MEVTGPVPIDRILFPEGTYIYVTLLLTLNVHRKRKQSRGEYPYLVDIVVKKQ